MRYAGVLLAGLLLMFGLNASAFEAPASGMNPVQEAKKKDQKKDQKKEESEDSSSTEEASTPVLDPVRKAALEYSERIQKFLKVTTSPAFSKNLQKANKKGRKALEAFLKESGRPDPKESRKLVEEMEQVAAYSMAFLSMAGSRSERTAAVKYVLKHHIDSDAMELIVDRPGINEADYRRILKENSNPRVQAIATYSLGRLLADDNPEEAEKLLESVVEKYPDVVRNGTPLGESATKALFPIKFLRVGAVAPDIEGEDIDGVEFKLSDYRGKVVLLDFWGDW